MAEEISLQHLQPQPVVLVTMNGKMEEIAEMLGTAYEKVGTYLQEQNTEPIGAPLARYLAIEQETVTLQAGFPVSQPMTVPSPFVSEDLPGGTVAMSLFTGPYRDLDTAHDALKAWILNQQLEPVGAPWESYLTDPADEKDETKFQTHIYWLVRKLTVS